MSAHPPIRTRGTVGGSLAHADPAAELPAALVLAAAARCAAARAGGARLSRRRLLRRHARTAAAPDEWVDEVACPRAGRRARAARVRGVRAPPRRLRAVRRDRRAPIAVGGGAAAHSGCLVAVGPPAGGRAAGGAGGATDRRRPRAASAEARAGRRPPREPRLPPPAGRGARRARWPRRSRGGARDGGAPGERSDRADGQRRRARARGRAAPAARRLPARGPRAHRHARRLRARRLRRLHGAGRRRARARSCLMLAVQADGRAITTVEGLRRRPTAAAPAPGGLPRQPRAAVRLLHAGLPHDCSPRLLREHPSRPTTRSARRSAGNLCRCTGYEGIVRAVSGRGGDRGRAR